jgi:7-carboxy-7-deazaguanine synthase
VFRLGLPGGRELKTFPINEIFETVQGEAYYTGTPAVFVRLQGCTVGCPWCDTKHTWPVNAADAASIDHMLAKKDSEQSYANMTVEQIVEAVNRFKARHVVITGGEPCDYDLTELTKALPGPDGLRTVQIETSGTVLPQAAYWTWITVSPKIDMPGGRKVLLSALREADEIKMPVGKQVDIDKLKALLASMGEQSRGKSGPPLVWLQPLSQSEKATELCVQAATENGWRISIQTHKYLNVR